jgi:hypothetical protein
MCGVFTTRSHVSMDSHISVCTGAPPPPAAPAPARAAPATKRLPYAAGPNAALLPPTWWAPVAHSRASGAAHEALCGVCQEALPAGGATGALCAHCPGAFHAECLSADAVPPPGAARAAWSCPTCEVRAARGDGPLVCNFCGRCGGRETANRLLVAVRPGGHGHAVAAHKWCADYSSGNRGTPYDPEVLWTEFWRARRLSCALCSRSGASAGCASGRCQRSFHAQCALEQPAKVAFCGATASLACVAHRSALTQPDGPPPRLPPPAPAASAPAAAAAAGVSKAGKPQGKAAPSGDGGAAAGGSGGAKAVPVGHKVATCNCRCCAKIRRDGWRDDDAADGGGGGGGGGAGGDAGGAGSQAKRAKTDANGGGAAAGGGADANSGGDGTQRAHAAAALSLAPAPAWWLGLHLSHGAAAVWSERTRAWSAAPPSALAPWLTLLTDVAPLGLAPAAVADAISAFIAAPRGVPAASLPADPPPAVRLARDDRDGVVRVLQHDATLRAGAVLACFRADCLTDAEAQTALWTPLPSGTALQLLRHEAQWAAASVPLAGGLVACAARVAGGCTLAGAVPSSDAAQQQPANAALVEASIAGFPALFAVATAAIPPGGALRLHCGAAHADALRGIRLRLAAVSSAAAAAAASAASSGRSHGVAVDTALAPPAEEACGDSQPGGRGGAALPMTHAAASPPLRGAPADPRRNGALEPGARERTASPPAEPRAWRDSETPPALCSTCGMRPRLHGFAHCSRACAVAALVPAVGARSLHA